MFIDEIHRFNKAQQDALLPAIEKGIVRLIEAMNRNLFCTECGTLSRVQVLTLGLLSHEALSAILERAENLLDITLPLDNEARDALLAMADGDGAIC